MKMDEGWNQKISKELVETLFKKVSSATLLVYVEIGMIHISSDRGISSDRAISFHKGQANSGSES